MIVFTRVAARDTFAYRSLDFKFKEGIHSVIGDNGASKTSIFMTLIQCLFNKNPKGTLIDDVSNTITNDPYEIEVWFTKGASEWHVINSKKSGKIEIYETVGGVRHDRHLKRIPDNLKLIEDVLGADYNTFVDLIYQSPKSSIDLLETKSDGGRKKFINRILKLTELDYHLERMKDREKELAGKNGKLISLQKQVATFEASISEVKEEIPEIDPGECSENLAVERLCHEHLVGDLAIANAKWNRAGEDLAVAYKQQANRTELELLRTQAAGIVAPEKSEEELLGLKEAAQAVFAAANAKRNSLSLQVDVAAKQQATIAKISTLLDSRIALTEPEHPADFCTTNLEKLRNMKAAAEAKATSAAGGAHKLKLSLGSGTCPTCKQELPNRDEINYAIVAEELIVTEEGAKVSKAAAAITKFTAMLEVWGKLVVINSQLATLQAQVGEKLDILSLIAEQESTEQTIVAATSTIKVLEAEITTHRNLRALQGKITALEAQVGTGGSVDELTSQVNELERLKEFAAVAVTASATTIKELEAAVEQIRNNNALSRARADLNRQINESNSTIRLQLAAVQEELAAAENGLEDIRTWLGILGSKGYRVHKIDRFLKNFNGVLQRYSYMISSGRIKCHFFLDEDGEIQFTVTDAFKTVPFANWSEGQKTRVKLACLFAVLELMEVLGVVSFNILCLDDMLGAIDKDGKEGLFKVLDYLRHKGTAIYTVSQFELALALVYDSEIHAVMLEDGTTTITQ